MIEIPRIQEALRDTDIDAWLFVDHHGRDEVSAQVLGQDVSHHATRRWFYLIPQSGEPLKLVHRIESKKLASLPGRQSEYSRWDEQQQGVVSLCKGFRRIAMQYSPNGMLLLLSNVDAGIVELVRTSGAEVVSSASLVQRVFGTLTPEQIGLQFEAGRVMDRLRGEVFQHIAERIGRISESQAREFLLERFQEEGLETDHGPVVAYGKNSADPHYEPRPGSDALIERGEVILIDMWAKLRAPEAPYYDITWVGCAGEPKSKEVITVFAQVAKARDAAIELVKERVSKGKSIRGYEVDRASRSVIEIGGYGKFFTHRTGHSISTSVHGVGVNMDDFETHDDREIVPGSCFSIEPGVYLDAFGIRLETNMVITTDSSGAPQAAVSGALQHSLLIL